MRAWLQTWGSDEGHRRGRSLAGWAAVLALLGGVLALDPAPFVAPPEPAAAPVLTKAQRAAQDRCVEGALLVHDVRWAAACTRLAERGASEDHPECELPPAESERLHLLLHQAEQQCNAEAARMQPR